jgi:inner membrane transporter RhtA
MSRAEPSVSAASVSRFQALTGVIPPWLLVVTAIVSVQLGAALAEQLFDTVGPSGVVFLRTLFGAVMFLVLWRPKIRGYQMRDYATILLYGIVISAMMLLFYAAIDRIPLGIAVAIAFAGPLSVAVIGSRRLIDLLWVALAAIGILLLSPLTDASLDPLGLLMAVLSAVSWIAFIVLTKQVGRTFHQNAGLAIGMGVAAVVSLPFGLSGAVKLLTNPSLIALSVVVAVLSSAIPFGLEFRALQQLPSRVYGLLTSIEPVVATIIGFTVLREALGLREVVGILLVTIAAAATARSAPKVAQAIQPEAEALERVAVP